MSGTGRDMLFHTFSSQEERIQFGGGDFYELQFCRLPPGTELETIVASDSVRYWLDDSLYVSGDDDSVFFKEYGGIFDRGVYNNMERGPADPYGINYYPPVLICPMLSMLLKTKPTDYERLAQWLERARGYNGFYFLGV